MSETIKAVKQAPTIETFVAAPPHPETEWSACTLYSPNAAEVASLIDVPLEAASICAGSDGAYVLVGMANSADSDAAEPALMMWKSEDFTAWRSIGQVSIEAGDAAYNAQPANARIHYLHGTYWLACGMQAGGTGLLRSVSGAAEGPYSLHAAMTEDGNDASLFMDEDGTVYWIYADGNIAKLNDGLTSLAETPCQAQIHPWKGGFRKDKPFHVNDPRIGTFGAFMLKRNGKYFLFGSERFDRMNSDSIDTFVAVSDQLYGPYSRRYLAVPHGGLTTLFAGPGGAVYAAFSGCGFYSPVDGRPAAIAMTFDTPDFIRPSEDYILERGPVAHLKPSADFLIRDPHIYLGPDGTYVLTGTSNKPHNDFWFGNDELHLWTSTDMRKWTHLTKAWDLHENGSWENNVHEHPCLWAPETVYVHGTYWLTYSVQGGGTVLLKSSTGKAEGPYVDMGRMTNTNIDSSLFVDDDGKVYYVWQDGKIARMKPNMSGFADEPRTLLTVDGETVGYEGAFIVKYAGKYILGAAEWYGDERVDGTYDLMYATADHILGPYTSSRVAVPHGGHGTMFIDRRGRLMSTLFGNDRTAPFRTQVGIVALKVETGSDGLIITPDFDDNTSY
jgi:beta-xylosidase